MANHKGSEGVVKIGSDTIAEVKDWSFDETADTTEDTVMGDAARTRIEVISRRSDHGRYFLLNVSAYHQCFTQCYI